MKIFVETSLINLEYKEKCREKMHKQSLTAITIENVDRFLNDKNHIDLMTASLVLDQTVYLSIPILCL